MSDIGSAELPKTEVRGQNLLDIGRKILEAKRAGGLELPAEKRSLYLTQYRRQEEELKREIGRLNIKEYGLYPRASDFRSLEAAGLAGEAMFLCLMQSAGGGEAVQIANMEEDRKGVDFLIKGASPEKVWEVDVTVSPNEGLVQQKLQRDGSIIVVIPSHRGSFVGNTEVIGDFQKAFSVLVDETRGEVMDSIKAKRFIGSLAKLNKLVYKERLSLGKIGQEQYKRAKEFFSWLEENYGRNQ